MFIGGCLHGENTGGAGQLNYIDRQLVAVDGFSAVLSTQIGSVLTALLIVEAYAIFYNNLIRPYTLFIVACLVVISQVLNNQYQNLTVLLLRL